jgi:hypothetical protein
MIQNLGSLLEAINGFMKFTDIDGMVRVYNA